MSLTRPRSLGSSRAGYVDLTEGRAPEPDIILAGPTEAVIAFLLGRIDAAR